MNVAFCRTLVDEWARAGVTDAVVSPGSRSTPLAIAVAESLRTQVILDERAAAFTALGLALGSGRPTVLVCTSGTAAAEYHAAVVEASQGFVPLIVCTADRPPESWDIGAPQTIDQVGLYGTAVRWAHSPGPPDPATRHTWRSLGARAVFEATGAPPGPVHLNLAFREPLTAGIDDPLPQGRPRGRPWTERSTTSVPAVAGEDVARLCADANQPVIVTGAHGSDRIRADTVPILGDHRGPLTGTVAHWDLLLRDEGFVADLQPDLVVCNGTPPASKALAGWLAGLEAPRIVLTPGQRWIDPHHTATVVCDHRVALEVSAVPGWAEAWIAAGEHAATAIEATLGEQATVSEPAVARDVFATRPPDSTLVVSSSMPIRDLESFATPRHDVRVLANRGANGIDGVLSTALGVALAGAPTTLVIGDLALLHDAAALTDLAARPVDLTVVVVDNTGGGIFSFLPQRDELDADRFEELFGTPHRVDLAALLTAHGIPSRQVTTRNELHAALGWADTLGGLRAIQVRTDRAANPAVHDALAAAVAATTR